MDSSAYGIIGMFVTFLHFIAMVVLAGGGFGLVKLGARPGLDKLKIAGYGLCAIVVASLIGMLLNFIITTFLVTLIGYETVTYWHLTRQVIGAGVDILGFAAFGYGVFAAGKG